MEVRGQLIRGDFLGQETELCCQAWQQSPLSAEPSHWSPRTVLFWMTPQIWWTVSLSIFLSWGSHVTSLLAMSDLCMPQDSFTDTAKRATFSCALGSDYIGEKSHVQCHQVDYMTEQSWNCCRVPFTLWPVPSPGYTSSPSLPGLGCRALSYQASADPSLRTVLQWEKNDSNHKK